MTAEHHDGSWPSPTSEQLDQAERLIRHPRRLEYFLGRLDNPLWLAPLAARGWFDLERVPEPALEDDGTIRINEWPPAAYLARVAQDVPGIASDIIETVSSTTNPLVQRRLVTALLALPPQRAASFLSAVVSWIRGPYAAWLNEGDLTKLTTALLQLEDSSVGEVLALTLLTAIHDEYVLGEIARALAEPLAGASAAGVAVFAEALDRHADETHRLNLINFSRVSIAAHPQNHNLHGDTDPLIDGLRDAALGYLRRTGDLSILDELAARPDAIYRRIAYYVATALTSEQDTTSPPPRPDIRPDSVRPLHTRARDMVMADGAMGDASTRLEYGLLVHAMLPYLSIAEVATVTEWVRAGPQLGEDDIQYLTDVAYESSADAVAAFADQWRAERLALFGPRLPGPLQAIMDGLTAKGVEVPEHPGLSHVTYPWTNPPSPLSAAEVAAMPVDRLIDWLSGYQPSSVTLFDTPEASLANRIVEDIRSRPTEYASHATQFATLPPLYIGGLLTGLQTAIAQSTKQTHPDGELLSLDLDWTALLDASAIIAGRPDTDEPNALHAADSPRWLHRSLAHLIETGLTVRTSGLTLDQADRILAVISRLLESPDPLPVDEAEDEATSDPTSRSINSVRGLAMHSIMAFISWWHRQGETEASIPSQLATLLEQHVDASRDPSAAVRSVYGQHIQHLHLHLPLWTRAHLEEIFGPPTTKSNPSARDRQPEPDETRTHSQHLGQVAFDTCLLSIEPYSGLWTLLAPYYEDAIRTLSQPPRGRRGATRDTRQRLLDHMLRYVIWGVLDKDDPRLKPVFRSTWAGDAFKYLGVGLHNTPQLDEDTADRLRALWTWWRTRAEARHASDDADSAGRMIAGFPRWWHASKLGATWEFNELRAVLKLSPNIEAPSMVIEDMTKKYKGHEREALDTIEIILDNVADDGQRYYSAGKAEPILRDLAHNEDLEITRLLQRFLQTLASWGMTEFAKRIAAESR
jgi:hypothetical protein